MHPRQNPGYAYGTSTTLCCALKTFLHSGPITFEKLCTGLIVLRIWCLVGQKFYAAEFSTLLLTLSVWYRSSLHFTKVIPHFLCAMNDTAFLFSLLNEVGYHSTETITVDGDIFGTLSMLVSSLYIQLYSSSDNDST